MISRTSAAIRRICEPLRPCERVERRFIRVSYQEYDFPDLLRRRARRPRAAEAVPDPHPAARIPAVERADWARRPDLGEAREPPSDPELQDPERALGGDIPDPGRAKEGRDRRQHR